MSTQEQRRLIVISGAGLSADSGLETFRAKDGTWANHSIDQVCNIMTWKANFTLVHDFYNRRREALQGVEPNAMHRLLARWETELGAVLITQNIDDLLERAGAERVLHLHGFLPQMRCEACGEITDIGYRAWDPEQDRCGCGCRKGMKPNVVFFGEQAPAYADMARALTGLSDRDVLVVIGTDGAVVPVGSIAAALPCRKVLNTLAPVDPADWRPGMVASALFNRTLYKPAVQAVDELDAIVRRWLSEPAPI